MHRYQLGKSAFNIGIIVILLIGTLLSWLSFQAIHDRQFTSSFEQLEQDSTYKRELIRRSILTSREHINFLHATPPIQGIVRASSNLGFDPLENTPIDLWKGRLEAIFSAYVKNKPHIKQIRYIGTANSGLELVRVDRQGKQVKIIPLDQLQQKGDRDYFRAAIQLKQDELYLSPISLNREFGKIEQPAWPTFRIAKAVFDLQGNLFGIVIINFDASPMLNSLSPVTQTDFLQFLLNSEEQFLVHPDSEHNFSFEYGDERTWQTESSISEFNKRNVFISINGDQQELLHLRKPVFDGQDAPGFELSLVTAVSVRKIEESVWQEFGATLVFNLVFIIALLFIWGVLRIFSALAQQKERLQAEFQAIFDASLDAIVHFDKQGGVLAANHTAKALLSIEKGRPFDESELRKHSQAIHQAIVTTLSDGSAPLLELEILADGKPKTVSALFSPVRLAAQTTSIAAIFRDTTEEASLRNQLAKSNQQLAYTNEEMKGFVYSVSHDLKSPLVTIGSFAERIAKSVAPDALGDKNTHRLERILVNVNLMSQLLSELLDISRIIQQEIKLDKCFVDTCLDTACTALEAEIKASNALIEQTKQSALPENKVFIANQALITQCLQNLVSNAIKYRKPDVKPHIIIDSRHIDEDFELSVSDNGLGIDPQYHQQIFRIFERLDVGEGTGVGLSIVKSIVEKHEGKIKLISSIGEGSCFTLSIPQSSLTGKASNE